MQAQMAEKGRGWTRKGERRAMIANRSNEDTITTHQEEKRGGERRGEERRKEERSSIRDRPTATDFTHGHSQPSLFPP